MKKAIFPGSFDPITLGHHDIIERGVTLFDELIIAIGINADKNYMFSLEERKQFIEDSFGNNPKIKIVTYEGLTVHFCQENNIDFILRGLRNPADFEFEKSIAHTNRDLSLYRNCVFINGCQYFLYFFFNCERCDKKLMEITPN